MKIHLLRLFFCFSFCQNLRWLNSNSFVWTDGLQALFVFQRTGNWQINFRDTSPTPAILLSLTNCFFLLTAAVFYYYLYKRTAEYMGDPRLYEDSLWLRDAFARARQ